MEKYQIFHLKIIDFTAVKYCSILHGRVCVMSFVSRDCVDSSVKNYGMTRELMDLVVTACASVCSTDGCNGI